MASRCYRFTSFRLNLPSDALEEFLSILRPSFFTPTSPTFRARRHESASALAVPLERPQAFRPRDGTHSKSPSLSSAYIEDDNATVNASNASPASDGRQGGDNDHLVGTLWRIPGILGKLYIRKLLKYSYIDIPQNHQCPVPTHVTLSRVTRLTMRLSRVSLPLTSHHRFFLSLPLPRQLLSVFLLLYLLRTSRKRTPDRIISHRRWPSIL